MLVLSRKSGERIIIGDNIELTVVEVRGDRVRLGFVAPTETPIHREEIWAQLQQEQAAPATAAPRKRRQRIGS